MRNYPSQRKVNLATPLIIKLLGNNSIPIFLCIFIVEKKIILHKENDHLSNQTLKNQKGQPQIWNLFE